MTPAHAELLVIAGLAAFVTFLGVLFWRCTSDLRSRSSRDEAA